MKRIILIIATATVLLRGNPQDTASVTGADVTEVGIYTAHVARTFAVPGVGSGTNEALDSFTLVQATTNIPARLGARFGFRYTIHGTPSNAPIILRMVAEHPAYKNSKTGKTQTRDVYELESRIGQAYTCYSFDDEAELMPGTFKFEVWHKDRKLCEQSFEIVPDKESEKEIAIKEPASKGAKAETNLPMNAQDDQTGRYAAVNGLKMYYEIHGNGKPLVLLHGGGSTIESTFGRILPELAKTHRVIAVELQAHGHTKDIDRPLSFEQDADDVAALLKQLNIGKADFMGFSNGGTTCLQIAIRHPQLVKKLVLAAATYKRDGMQPGFFDGFKNASLEMMPQPLKEAYLKANPDPKGLQAMFDRDVARMAGFRDIADADIKGIEVPTLILNGDTDVVRPEHALQLFHMLPHAKLAILPGGHGECIGEVCSPDKDSKVPALVVALIEDFLKG